MASKDVPVLFLDTCTILDIIRDPTREDVLVQEHTAFVMMLSEIESKESFKAIIAEQVRSELNDRTESVQQETARAIRNFREQFDKVSDLAALYGSSSNVDTSHLHGYEDRCRGIMDRWLKVCTVATQSDEAVSRAFARVCRARTPARKGKDSMKDCVILETYLEHLRDLRDSGLTSPAVFVSSNKKDYATTKGGGIRDDARAEFKSVGLEYAPNMAAANYLLGI